MSSIIDNLKSQFRDGSNLTRFLYINLGIFILIQVIYILTGGKEDNPWGNAFVRLLAMPGDPLTLLTKPWTIFTYMFSHEGLAHLFGNLIVLYFVGRIFQEYLGERRFLTVYIGGGIFGGLLFFLVYNFTPIISSGDYLIGASAGVMAIIMALTFYVPNLPIRLFFLIEVKLWHIAVGLFLLDLSGIASLNNEGGRIAHIGGLLFGFLFITQLKKGKDWSETAYAFAERIKQMFKAKPKLKTVHKSNSPRKSSTTNKSDQIKLDEILDKIKVSGYDKLTKEEKEFLFKFGNK